MSRLKFITASCYTFFIYGAIAIINTHMPIVLEYLRYSPSEIGKLLSVYNLAGLISIVLLAKLLNSAKRYPIVLFGTQISSITCFNIFVSSDLGLWTYAAVSVFAASLLVQASLSDTFISEQYRHRPDYYGKIRGIGSLGFTLTLLGIGCFRLLTPYSPENIKFLFALFIGLSLLSLFLNLLTKPFHQTAPLSKENRGFPSNKPNQQTGIEKLGRPFIILLLTITFFWGLMMSVNSSFLPLYLKNILESPNISFIYVIATASEIPIIFFAGKILHRRPLGILLVSSLLAASIRLGIYAAVPHFPSILLIQVFHSIAYGLYHISAITIVNRYFDKYRSIAIGIYSSIPIFSATVGNLFGGFIIDRFGFQALFTIYLAPIIPILFAVYGMRKRFKQL